MQERTTADKPADRDETDIIRIRAAVQAAYDKGFEFHKRAVKSSPALLDWVHRKDYWDYRFPSVDSKKLERLRREVLDFVASSGAILCALSGLNDPHFTRRHYLGFDIWACPSHLSLTCFERLGHSASLMPSCPVFTGMFSPRMAR